MGKTNFNEDFKRDTIPQIAVRGYAAREVSERLGVRVIPRFYRGSSRRIYAAVFSFMAGVMPPIEVLPENWALT